jgi:hypothetical protein
MGDGMMSKDRKGFRVSAALLAVILIALLPLQAIAQGSDTEEKNVPCNPVSESLAEEMGINCQELVDLQNDEAGLGEIMKAWYLAQRLEDFGGDWETLLEMKQQNIGWGQFKMAYRLADSDTSADQLLLLKQAGLGWGQIRKAQALSQAGLGLSFDQSLEMFSGDLEWGQIRDQLGLPEGPPPWAGGIKTKDSQGRPPWAGGNGRSPNSGE